MSMCRLKPHITKAENGLFKAWGIIQYLKNTCIERSTSKCKDRRTDVIDLLLMVTMIMYYIFVSVGNTPNKK